MDSDCFGQLLLDLWPALEYDWYTQWNGIGANWLSLPSRYQLQINISLVTDESLYSHFLFPSAICLPWTCAGLLHANTIPQFCLISIFACLFALNFGLEIYFYFFLRERERESIYEVGWVERWWVSGKIEMVCIATVSYSFYTYLNIPLLFGCQWYKESILT